MRRLKMAIIGYARATDLKHLDVQISTLMREGCDEVFSEVAPGGMNRSELTAMIESLNEGDTVLVLSIDRVFRTHEGLNNVLDQITKKGCKLVSLQEGELSNDPSELGHYILERRLEIYEKQIMRERQAKGIAAARARGVRLGRPPKKSK
jgi:DNA invertase Pin-like site-specific DNA recombinase